MKQAHHENLSAGVDGELTSAELRFLLRRLDHDTDLRETWTRYHVARDGLRRQLPAMASADFAERVQRAIEREQVTEDGRHLPHWLRWSGGGAIAAGVAVAALMLAQPSGDRSDGLAAGSTPALSNQMTASVAPAPEPATPAAVPPWLSGDTASQFSQQAAATLGDAYGDGTLPYARGLSPYQLKIQTIHNQGGYLLLVDPQSSVARPTHQASAVAQ